MTLDTHIRAVQPIRALVALDETVRRDVLEQALPGDEELEIVGVLDGLDKQWKTLDEVPNDLLIVAAAGYSEHAVGLIKRAVAERPLRPVVVLTEAAPSGYLKSLFEAGADDVITLPESIGHVSFSLAKALARKQGTAVTTRLSPLVCVLGPKGGTGKTFTATNLGVSLAAAGRRVALVDLDLQYGDVGLALGLAPERTIYDLARAAGTLDGEKLESYLTRHESGLRVLLAPSRPDQATAVTTEFLGGLYSMLRATNDVVIVDTPPGVNSEVLVSIESSSDVILVATLDSLSLKSAKLALETLELLKYQGSRIQLLLSRTGAGDGIAVNDLRAVLGRGPDVVVPYDRDVARALSGGRALVTAKPKSEAAQTLLRLAERYATEGLSTNGSGSSPNGSRRRLFGRAA